MATQNKKYRLIRIRWMDIIRPDATWMFPEELKTLEPAKITTVGWIVDETSEQITIASSLGDDRQLGDINCIPKSVVQTIEDLGETYEDNIDVPLI